MGLDMYLNGRKYFYSDNQAKEDGYRVSEHVLELGYWRKHPNLHGFIVREFADGVDECQDIPLDVDALKKIIKATSDDALPHTEGFFFGVSDPEDKEPTLRIMADAIKWLNHEDSKNESRSVIYRASW
jgi:hypothetical protein